MRRSYSMACSISRLPPLPVNAVVKTVSLSGNAFSVKNGLGKFRSPCGHDLLSQNNRMYVTTFAMSVLESASPKAGMCLSRPRIGPPSWTTVCQSASDSAVAKAQSVKSGGWASKPITFLGEPLPSRL